MSLNENQYSADQNSWNKMFNKARRLGNLTWEVCFYNHILEPIPWNWVFEKPTFAQLLNNYPKVYYRINKNLSMVHIISQMNPFHNTSYNFSKILFNIILLPTSRSP
jgi:hypothetical protein